MKVCLVDTAILTDVLVNFGPQRDVALKALRSFDTTKLPVYAIKEFKAGALGALAWLHNKLVMTGSVADTVVYAQRLMSHRKNLPATALQALAREMRSLEEKTPAELAAEYGEKRLGDISKDLCKHAIRYRIMKAWEDRRKVTKEVVWPCSCYAEVPPRMKRELVDLGPRNCASVNECAMAKALTAHPKDLEKLLAVVKELRSGQGSQYQAVRGLVRTPTRGLTDARCRALGDVVFACVCPDGAVILTTNLRDHGPLAAALGKTAISPEGVGAAV